MGIEIRMDESKLRQFLYGKSGPIVREMRTRGQRVLNLARQKCPVDQGALRASLDMTVEVKAPRVILRIGSPLFYAVYVHDGTGIYGPRRRMIRPISAKMLAWQTRGGKWVFARQVKGMRPRPFLADALQELYPAKTVRRTR